MLPSAAAPSLHYFLNTWLFFAGSKAGRLLLSTSAIGKSTYCRCNA
jgi:hypothetical protein